jgi:hypothetical protein
MLVCILHVCFLHDPPVRTNDAYQQSPKIVTDSNGSVSTERIMVYIWGRRLCTGELGHGYSSQTGLRPVLRHCTNVTVPQPTDLNTTFFVSPRFCQDHNTRPNVCTQEPQ